MLKEFFSSTKRIIIKIIPHHSESIYKLEMSHRHMALLAMCAIIFAASMITSQIGAVNAANAQLHKLQMTDAQQHRQLLAFSKQTRDMMTRLKVLQHSEREIRKLTGIATPPKTEPKRKPAALRPAPAAAHAAKPEMTTGRDAQTGPISFWSRVRSLLSGGRDGGALTFAAESAELAVLDFQINDALAASNALEAKAATAAEAKRRAALARQRYLDAIPSIWPTDGYVSSGFGYRSYPNAEFHAGLDIVNDYGAPIYATAAGVVSEAGWDGGYGYKIVIDHGNGYETWYAHDSRILVNAGDTVRKGEEIARVGSSGFATGPHVHYEIVQLGRPVDPTPYLSGVPAQLAKM